MITPHPLSEPASLLLAAPRCRHSALRSATADLTLSDRASDGVKNAVSLSAPLGAKEDPMHSGRDGDGKTKPHSIAASSCHYNFDLIHKVLSLFFYFISEILSFLQNFSKWKLKRNLLLMLFCRFSLVFCFTHLLFYFVVYFQRRCYEVEVLHSVVSRPLAHLVIFLWNYHHCYCVD